MKHLDLHRQQSSRSQDGLVMRKLSHLDRVLIHTVGDPLVSLLFNNARSGIFMLGEQVQKFKTSVQICAPECRIPRLWLASRTLY
jgi:hypothetical protein